MEARGLARGEGGGLKMADTSHPAYFKISHSWCSGSPLIIDLYRLEGKKAVHWGWACSNCGGTHQKVT